ARDDQRHRHQHQRAAVADAGGSLADARSWSRVEGDRCGRHRLVPLLLGKERDKAIELCLVSIASHTCHRWDRRADTAHDGPEGKFTPMTATPPGRPPGDGAP